MLSLVSSLAPLFLFLLIPLIIDGVGFLSFYYSSFPILKKEWSVLAKQFELATTIKFHGPFPGWAFGYNLKASGILQNYPINFDWKRTRKSEFGEFTCTIEVKNPHSVEFLLKKGTMLLGKKNLAFETAYFKEKFNISTNNVEEISQVFNEEIQNSVRKIFAIELDATLTVKKIKGNRSNTILDARDAYSLVYFNPNYQINNNRQNLFMQETLLSMVEIAKRIDAIT